VSGQDPRLRQIWFQTKVPVVYRPGGSERLLVRLPYAAGNRVWLKGQRRNKPKWNATHKRWEIPKSWFEDVVRRAMAKYGAVYVIEPFRLQKKCAPACWNAKGLECDCSCMGQNHGTGDPSGRWYFISDALAVNWGPRRYSYKLMRPSKLASA
jgi:hypothetical protein